MSNPDSFSELIHKVMNDNQFFFESTSVKKEILHEIVELIQDAIDFFPTTKTISPDQIFAFHGFTPISAGIYISFLSGNIASCFMQLRLLIEFYAYSQLAQKLFPDDDAFIQLDKTRKKYTEKYKTKSRIKLSKMILDFDPKAHKLWKHLSTWTHGITYSRKAIRNVVRDKLTLGSIVQPATYDDDDMEQLQELKRQVKTFRRIIQNNK